MIDKGTRRNIIDHFEMAEIQFSGRMSDLNFLTRIYDLKKLPSLDHRFEDAYGDIYNHTENNCDYEFNWVFTDSRFNLLEGDDETFLRFICEMTHPLVRPDQEKASKIISIANDWLKAEGWELYPEKEVASGFIFSFKETNRVQVPKDEEVANIWFPNSLKFFISHRDIHKGEAKGLGEKLKNFGISCFVAHDSIQPMSTWKHEIMKALLTMDACICYIKDDFYKSEWTNQEVGFALARGIPIYLFSVDKTDPKGFKIDTQAIKAGFPDLINCIKKDFEKNNKFKNYFIDNFVKAINGSFENAKNMFYELIDINLNDEEIEQVVFAFSAEAKYLNQLSIIISAPIKPEHKDHPKLKNYSYYREFLENDILTKHTKHSYCIEGKEIVKKNKS
ncbi:AbiJ-related protein [Fluviispira vulneris]|uniref:AbiJ-related protein n=1 Tax=Fluviispira vulneris TaxID=2763012 RepID=UPI00164555AF|nr:TIR domain-containing protein [Fluviispira vulneris]